jgi:hypothetical protein
MIEPEVLRALAEVLRVFATGVFITTLVSSILNFYFQQEINRHFSIIDGAERAGIIRIYEDRNAAMPQINSEFQRARGKMELLAISGTDFFQSSCRILKELDSMCSSDSNVQVRILLLDPRSKHAVDRSLIEEGIDISKEDIATVDYTDGKLCHDTLIALDQLERILREKMANGRRNFDMQVQM